MINKIKILVRGMHCNHCEKVIEESISGLEGIVEVKANYVKSDVMVTFDDSRVSRDQIDRHISEAGYTIGQNKKVNKKYLAAGVIIVAIYLIIQNTVSFNYIPQIEQNAGYGLLFLVGLITSLHCLAMCGGLAISQTFNKASCLRRETTREKILPSLIYNTGRLISYTILGGIVGGIGSIISLSGQFKGTVAVIAGLLMVIMGLNMLNISPLLRKINIRLPRVFPFNNLSNKSKSPFIVGLLNGFMPCGPLQTMQLYALGTGSILKGSLSMFAFALGTMPLMTALGYLTNILSRKITNKFLKLSAVLVIVLGLIMASRGLVLSGVPLPDMGTNLTGAANNEAIISEGRQVIEMTADNSGYTPNIFFVQKGIPVKWIIKGDRLNSCNNEIIVPEYNISKKLFSGENIIEFTPNESKDIAFSCWMGMISGKIKVVDDLAKITEKDRQKEQSLIFQMGDSCCANTVSQGDVTVKDISNSIMDGQKQKIAMKVDPNGYNPRILIVEKGKNVEFTINAQNINSCIYAINFLGSIASEIPLREGKTIIEFTPEDDILPFTCPMGMFSGYIVTVDDIGNIDKQGILKKVQQVKLPPSGCGMMLDD